MLFWIIGSTIASICARISFVASSHFACCSAKRAFSSSVASFRSSRQRTGVKNARSR